MPRKPGLRSVTAAEVLLWLQRAPAHEVSLVFTLYEQLRREATGVTPSTPAKKKPGPKAKAIVADVQPSLADA